MCPGVIVFSLVLFGTLYVSWINKFQNAAEWRQNGYIPQKDDLTRKNMNGSIIKETDSVV